MAIIKRLNVSRYVAGQSVPFDRFYLARGEDSRKVLKRAFKYALVMPLTEGIGKGLRETVVTVARNSPAAGRSSEWSAKETDFAEELGGHEDWLVVVPILPKIGAKNLPRYLTNKKWFTSGTHNRRRRRAESTPLPVLSYLQTPEENWRPVCIACPRFLQQQAGECQFGQQVCYETLVLGDGILLDREEAPPAADFQDDEVTRG